MKSIQYTLLFLVTILSSNLSLAQDQPVPYGDNPKAGHYANVNGIKMYYEIYGQGQPLLLIHGNGGSVKSSSSQIPFFAKKYRVIVMDSRGQGKTNDNSDSLTYSLMTEDVNAFLNYLHLDSVLVFGQSDGAILGLLLAARHPEKVKRLAAMSPNLRPDDDVFYPESAALNHQFFDILQKRVAAGVPGSERDFKLQRLMAYHPHIPTSELQKIKSPVLLLSADRDLIRLSHILEIYESIPKANLCILPGSTHFAIRQNPDVFNETLYRFLSEPFSMPSSTDYLKKILARFQ